MSAYASEEINEPAHTEGKELEGAAEKRVEGNREVRLKLLRDSAAALQASHADLAADLTKAADRQAKQIKEDQKEDAKEAGEKNE